MSLDEVARRLDGSFRFFVAFGNGRTVQDSLFPDITQYIGSGENGAVFCPSRSHRYTLWRRWNATELHEEKLIAFIGLNPSTADEVKNDPTVRRCIGFAMDWGYDTMVMLNIFGYRATDPRDMKAHPEPVGEQNDEAIEQVVRHADRVICCWGNHGAHLERSSRIRQILRAVGRRHIFHLGTTKSGEPKHPLYLASATPPQKWNAGE